MLQTNQQLSFATFDRLVRKKDLKTLTKLIAQDSKAGIFNFGFSFEVYLQAYRNSGIYSDASRHLPINTIISHFTTEEQQTFQQLHQQYAQNYSQAELKMLNSRTKNSKLQQRLQQLKEQPLTFELNKQIYKLYLDALKASVIPDFYSVALEIQPTHFTPEFRQQFLETATATYNLHPLWDTLIPKPSSVGLFTEAFAEDAEVSFNSSGYRGSACINAKKSKNTTASTDILFGTEEDEHLSSMRFAAYSDLSVNELDILVEFSKQQLSFTQVNLSVTTPYFDEKNAFFQACVKKDFRILDFLCKKLPQDGTFIFEVSPYDEVNFANSLSSCDDLLRFSVSHLAAFFCADYTNVSPMTSANPSRVLESVTSAEVISREVILYLQDVSTSYIQLKNTKMTQPADDATKILNDKIVDGIVNLQKQLNLKQLLAAESEIIHSRNECLYYYSRDSKPTADLLIVPELMNEDIEKHGVLQNSSKASTQLYTEATLRRKILNSIATDFSNLNDFEAYLFDTLDQLPNAGKKRLCLIADTNSWLEAIFQADAYYPTNFSRHLVTQALSLSSDASLQELFAERLSTVNFSRVYSQPRTVIQTLQQLIQKNHAQLLATPWNNDSNMETEPTELKRLAESILAMPDALREKYSESPKQVREIIKQAQKVNMSFGQLLSQIVQNFNAQMLHEILEAPEQLETLCFGLKRLQEHSVISKKRSFRI